MKFWDFTSSGNRWCNVTLLLEAMHSRGFVWTCANEPTHAAFLKQTSRQIYFWWRPTAGTRTQSIFSDTWRVKSQFWEEFQASFQDTVVLVMQSCPVSLENISNTQMKGLSLECSHNYVLWNHSRHWLFSKDPALISAGIYLSREAWWLPRYLLS